MSDAAVENSRRVAVVGWDGSSHSRWPFVAIKSLWWAVASNLYGRPRA